MRAAEVVTGGQRQVSGETVQPGGSGQGKPLLLSEALAPGLRAASGWG